MNGGTFFAAARYLSFGISRPMYQLGVHTMKVRFTALLLLALPTAILAQGNNDAKAKAALAPFAKLVGKWEGDARVTMVPGQPAQVVRQYEDIQLTNNGTMLKIVGIGRSTEPGARDSVVFRAAGRLWYDNAVNKLRLLASANGSDTVEADIQVKPDTLIWGFPVQGGRIRFTIAYSNTDWHEVGHFLMQNGTAIPTVDMRLKKVK